MIDLLPSDYYLVDEASPTLVLNDVDPQQDISSDEGLFSSDGAISSASEDPFLDDLDESNSLEQPPDGPEIASTSCISTFSPSGKSRKREDQCDARDSVGSSPKLPAITDLEDMLQEAMQRKFCSQNTILGAGFIPVCAYSKQPADQNTFWHVSGYLCEFTATQCFCPKPLQLGIIS